MVFSHDSRGLGAKEAVIISYAVYKEVFAYLSGTMIDELLGGYDARVFPIAHLLYVIEIAKVRKIQPCHRDLGPVQEPIQESIRYVGDCDLWDYPKI